MITAPPNPALPAREKTRLRIMETAEALCRRVGFTRMTIADIAEDLGMSTANIYNFFPSKGAIIQACADRSVNEISEELTRIARSPGGILKRIEWMMLKIYHHHLEVFKNEREIYRLVLAAHTENWACIGVFRATQLRLVTELIKEGCENREFRQVPARATAQMLLDSLLWITHAMLFHELPPKGVEQRLHAHLQFLGTSLHPAFTIKDRRK